MEPTSSYNFVLFILACARCARVRKQKELLGPALGEGFCFPLSTSIVCCTSKLHPSLSRVPRIPSVLISESYTCGCVDCFSYPDVKLNAMKPNRRVVRAGFLYRYSTSDDAVARQGLIVEESTLRQCSLQVRPVFVNKDFMVRSNFINGGSYCWLIQLFVLWAYLSITGNRAN